MTVPIPFAAQAYQLSAVQFAAQRCVNLYPEIGPPGSKTPIMLQSTPGLTTYATVGEGPIRGLIKMQEFVFVVSGDRLYRIDVNGAQRELGSLPGRSIVKLATNGEQILLLTGTSTEDGWIATTDDLTRITDEDFLGGSDVDFIDGYFILSRPESNEFYISALYNGLEYDPLDFARAEGAPDNIVGLVVDHREIWLIGEKTTEVWYNAGNADFPFERASGTFIERGTAARDSISQIDNTIMWVGDDRIVYRADGYSPVRVSTHAIEQRLNEVIGASDLISFGYSQDGHAHYVLKKPEEWTFVYDVATQLWHERCSCDRDFYKVSTYVAAFDRLLVGDDTEGIIYFFDQDRPGTEDAGTVVSRMASPPLFANEEEAVLNALVVDLERGEGRDDAFFQTADPDLATLEDGSRAKSALGKSVTTVTIPDFKVPEGLDPSVTTMVAGIIYQWPTVSPADVDSVTFKGDGFTDLGIKAQEVDTTANVVEVYALDNPTGQGDVTLTFTNSNATVAYLIVALVTDVELGSVDFDVLSQSASSTNAISGSLNVPTKPGLILNFFGAAKDGLAVATGAGHVAELVLEETTDGQVAALGIVRTRDVQSYTFGWQKQTAGNYNRLNQVGGTFAAAGIPTRPPQIMLRYSDDAGKTWSSEKWRSMGKVGEYKKRARWNRMGRFRQRVLELSISDPIPRYIMGAYAKIERGGL